VADASPKEHRTVSRVTTILETAAAQPDGVTLGQLAAVLGAPKSSVHGLAKGLAAAGYLREQDGRYLLGPAVGALLAAGAPSLSAAARPAMAELHESFDETVMLGTLVGDSVVYVDAIESSQLIRYSAPLNRRRPLYPTSTGKCFLAHMPSRRRVGYLAAHVPTVDRARVESELEDVRVLGVATNRGETLPDISAVAAPVLVGGRVVACLALAGPTSRMAAKLEPGAEAVRAAVQATTVRIGGD
jgi:DNA-binding IclR family transcriptional regulator